jgi:hypothetical protein
MWGVGFWVVLPLMAYASSGLAGLALLLVMYVVGVAGVRAVARR